MKQAVILAAGFGSRLARHDGDIKPLRQVEGASLIRRNLLLLEACGVDECIIIVGYRGAELQEAIESENCDLQMPVRFVFNPHYHKSNGISVLSAQPYIKGAFVLLMADHIFDQAIVEDAVRIDPPEDGAILCIDYKIDKVFDIDDATKVMTDGQRVLQISKQLIEYNAIDTGIFMCSPALFDALQTARQASANDDCSLSAGVAALLTRDRMMVHDVGSALWQDVDTELTLKHAERLLRKRLIDRSLGALARTRLNVAL
ncbi:MAG: NTP transferase domain-containing protein [Myxococcota bacterium]|nr:NTP transferase domain-containing protein [Myxococcota bacterium]